MNRAAALILAVILVFIMGIQGFAPLIAQNTTTFADATEATRALANARQQQRNARVRAERLEAEYVRAGEASNRARTEAAALAARVQQAEAGVTAAEAELGLVEGERRALTRDLARRSKPLAQLTGALEVMTRRPLVLAAFQPGNLRDLVHTRAVLGSALPIVRQRTANLRGDLERVEDLENERREFVARRRDSERLLLFRRRETLALAEKERVLAQQTAGGATREAALARDLATQTRDIDALVSKVAQSAETRDRLAALDGPVPRPSRPGEAGTPSRISSKPADSVALEAYLLPVGGRLTAGFGEATATGGRRSALTIRPRQQAQVVAPSGGRVAFADRYEGYGRIVILEHPGGWTSLVTGLGSLIVTTGQQVTTGSPLGLASGTNPGIGLELRRDGIPVNPLDHIR